MPSDQLHACVIPSDISILKKSGYGMPIPRSREYQKQIWRWSSPPLKVFLAGCLSRSFSPRLSRYNILAGSLLTSVLSTSPLWSSPPHARLESLAEWLQWMHECDWLPLLEPYIKPNAAFWLIWIVARAVFWMIWSSVTVLNLISSSSCQAK